MKFRENKGQTLIEMIVALTIVVVSLLGMFVLVSRSLGLNRLVSEQYTATYLAAEGIEIARNFFDKSYLEAAAAVPGSKNFYGWIDPTGGEEWVLQSGIYEIQYNEVVFPNSSNGGKVSDCEQHLYTTIIIPGVGTKTINFIAAPDAILNLHNGCSQLKYLKFNEATGVYGYAEGIDTKFKRVLIIEYPREYDNYVESGYVLDFRVTSVVYLESRGGLYTVHLQDHFLPWRIP